MRALLVDDDPAVVSIGRRWLTEAGYDVRTSTDFRDAVTELKTNAVDAVIVDVRLGEFNGLQLAHLARQFRASARIVVISGWDDPVLKREAACLGAPYLVKPFSASDLLTALGPGVLESEAMGPIAARAGRAARGLMLVRQQTS